MPFASVTIDEGHPKARKDVTPPDWYVAGNPGKK